MVSRDFWFPKHLSKKGKTVMTRRKSVFPIKTLKALCSNPYPPPPIPAPPKKEPTRKSDTDLGGGIVMLIFILILANAATGNLLALLVVILLGSSLNYLFDHARR